MYYEVTYNKVKNEFYLDARQELYSLFDGSAQIFP